MNWDKIKKYDKDKREIMGHKRYRRDRKRRENKREEKRKRNKETRKESFTLNYVLYQKFYLHSNILFTIMSLKFIFLMKFYIFLNLF